MGGEIGIKRGECWLDFIYQIEYGFNNNISVIRKDGREDTYHKDDYKDIIKNLTGSKGVREWRRESIRLSSGYQTFRLVVEAKVGVAGNQGLVAIDNVTFSEGCHLDMQPCQIGEFSCGDNVCLSNECSCNSKPDCKNKVDEKSCSNITCDFETKNPFTKCGPSDDGDCCGWKNETIKEKNRKNWEWKIGNTSRIQNLKTGPPFDHTFHNKSGHFIYVNPMDSDSGERDTYLEARLALVNLYSGTHYSSYHCKLFFWLQMYAEWEDSGDKASDAKKNIKKNGTDVYLEIYYNTSCSNTTISTKFMQITKDSKDWSPVLVSLPPCPRNFNITISAIGWFKSHTILAIDDLRFDCQQPSRRQCTSDEFQCTSTKQCIPKDTLCDLDHNCCDGSDENETMCADYMRMNFENGFEDEDLRWNQLQNQDYDDFDFHLQQGKGFNPGPLPWWDHTFQEKHGHFITIAAKKHLINEKAALASPTIRPTSNCSVRFWYHMSGHAIRSLTLSILHSYRDLQSLSLGHSIGNPVFVLFGDQGVGWKRGAVHLNSSKDFQVIFTASVGDCFLGGEGKISLDDISFTPGCQLFNGSLPGQPIKIKPRKSSCKKDEFQCANGTCIPRYYMCDFHQDCVGNQSESDEQPSICGYPKGFEHGLDPWTWPHEDTDTSMSFSFRTNQPINGTNVTESYAFYNTTKVCDRHPRAMFDSPWYQTAYSSCQLSWLYRMGWKDKEKNMSPVLYVYLITNEDVHDDDHLRLYATQNERLLTWKQVEITIGRRRTPFKIRFFAESSDLMIGYVHLSRINITNCDLVNDCRNDSFRCRNGQCIDPSKKCNLVDDCGDLSDEDPKECDGYFGCNFELPKEKEEKEKEKERWCGFYTELDNDPKSFNWTMKTGETGTLGTGPEHDHSLRTLAGHYLYIEASRPQVQSPPPEYQNDDISRPKGSKARLVSIPLKANKGCKMWFYYHMYGTGIGRLYINVLQGGDLKTGKLLKTFNGSKFRWRRGVVDLSDQKGVFNVEFVGEVGSSEKSDIAIDDILFEPGCEQTNQSQIRLKFPKITTCNTDQKMCLKTGNCVNKKAWCNGTTECKDGTDETKCVKGPKPTLKPNNDPVIIALLSSTLVVLLIAITAIIVIMKRRTAEKFHLFSIFYDPNAPPTTDTKIVRQVSDLSVGSIASNSTCGSSASDKEVKSMVNYGFHASNTHLYQEAKKAPSPVYQEPFYISD